jgi:hypothetical protein
MSRTVHGNGYGADTHKKSGGSITASTSVNHDRQFSIRMQVIRMQVEQDAVFT